MYVCPGAMSMPFMTGITVLAGKLRLAYWYSTV